MTNGTQPPTPDLGAAGNLYRALIALYLHQDALLWSRVQTLIAIQGAVLAGAYAVRPTWPCVVLPVLGAGLTLLLRSLVLKDQSDRDVNLDELDWLAAHLAGACGLPTAPTKKRVVSLTGASNPSCGVWRGRSVLQVVLWTFVMLDIAMAALLPHPDAL